jgi:hypothetical protein
MTTPASRPGPAAVATGAVIVLELLAARFLLRADEVQVYVLGEPIHWTCALRRRLGLPCPTCGITRSLVVSLHGEWGRAWQITPAGPAILLGLLGFGAAMLVLGWVQLRGAGGPAARARRWIRRTALAYAGFMVLVWLGGWIVNFRAALHSR